MENAALYLRMSSERQEASIGQQRSELTSYAAKHAYRIVAEYADEAVSGDHTEKRVSFIRMRNDAATGRFSVVLCWDQDRFGRFDPIEGGWWIKPFRDAGVRLETIAQGKIDWNDFAGRLLYIVQQEAKHAFLRDLSRNVSRGKIAGARAGRWQGGQAPYGYDVDEALRLVVRDPEKADTVRWIFHQYAHEGGSLRSIATKLNHAGLPSPSGGQWCVSGIRKLLRNPRYMGGSLWAVDQKGAYHTVAGGEVQPVKRKRKHTRNAAGSWIAGDGEHEPLVDRATWERVQRLLVERAEQTSPLRNSARSFKLSGLVFCGNCGAAMYGSTGRNRRSYGKKDYAYRRYVCGSYMRSGNARCGYYNVHEEDLVRCVAQLFRDRYATPAAMARLREEIERQMRAELEHQGNADEIKRQVAGLDRTIQQGARRLITLPDELVESVTTELERLRAQRDELKRRMADLKPGNTVEAEIAELTAAALGQLETLVDGLLDADPLKANLAARELVQRIELRFERTPAAKTMRTRFVHGEITVRRELRAFALVHPDCSEETGAKIPFGERELRMAA